MDHGLLSVLQMKRGLSSQPREASYSGRPRQDGFRLADSKRTAEMQTGVRAGIMRICRLDCWRAFTRDHDFSLVPSTAKAFANLRSFTTTCEASIRVPWHRFQPSYPTGQSVIWLAVHSSLERNGTTLIQQSMLFSYLYPDGAAADMQPLA